MLCPSVPHRAPLCPTWGWSCPGSPAEGAWHHCHVPKPAPLTWQPSPDFEMLGMGHPCPRHSLGQALGLLRAGGEMLQPSPFPCPVLGWGLRGLILALFLLPCRL